VPVAARRAEVHLVIRANACREFRNDIAWNDKAGFVETALPHHPGNGHDVRGRCGHEARSVDEDRAAVGRLGELSRLDLYSDRCPGRKASDQDFICLVVWKGPEQAAVLEEGQSSLYLLFAPEADQPVFIQNRLNFECQRRPVLFGAQPFREVVEGHQVLRPAVAWDRMYGHVGNEHLPAAVSHPRGFPLEGRGVHHQHEGSEVVTVEVYADDELIGREEVLLVNRDHSLGAGQVRLRLDLQCQVGAIVEPVNYRIEAAVEFRKEDMEAASRLCDERRPDQELARLADGILTAVGPAGLEVGHSVRSVVEDAVSSKRQNHGMRIAVLCDIHGNLPALQAVLAEVEKAGVDLVVFGGDVAAGPMPVETIEVLAGYRGSARFVRGNADRLMVETFDGARIPSEALDLWPATILNRTHRDFLNKFEQVVEVQVNGLGLVVCCHAGLDSDELPIITPATPDEVIAEALASAHGNLVVAGHTHMQFDRRVAGGRMVNAGSVGRPYADQPGAYWALLGPEVDLRRTAYDFAAAAEAVRRTAVPEREELAADIVRPPTAEEAIKVFENMAGRAYPR
jgi:putative phosphoesterase